MTNTQAFSTIDTDTLSDVSGGCGRRRCGCGTKNVSIVNNYAAAPAAPAPAPSNSGVSVSVGYQQA